MGVVQDVYFPHQHAPRLHQVQYKKVPGHVIPATDCADWAAIILGVVLYDAEGPSAWKTSTRLKLFLTTKTASYNKEAWNQVEAIAAGWSSSDDDE